MSDEKTEKMAVIIGILCFTLVFLGSISFCAGAEDPSKFPSKPIKLIIPYAPGGTSDLVGRKLCDLASNTLRQPMVAENKTGGAGGLSVARPWPNPTRKATPF